MALLLLPFPALAQQESFGQVSSPTIRSTSTLVIVPTLVRSISGELVTNLGARDFRLTDNAIEQRILAEEIEDQPIALVVLMQTGGGAPRQFQNYRTLNTIINSMASSATHKIALVTFDSRPEEIWNFPSQVDGLKRAFSRPETGDRGAAVLDAVNCGLNILQQQPRNLRRIILLLSQARDDGSSTATPEEVVQHLAESNTTIYSVTFPPDKGGRSDQTSPLRHDDLFHPKHLPSGPAPIMKSLSPSESFSLALHGIRDNTASEFAALSGGEQVELTNKLNLERTLSMMANDLSHGYALSFRPNPTESGFHTIAVQILNQRTHYIVTSRTCYWLDGATTQP